MSVWIEEIRAIFGGTSHRAVFSWIYSLPVGDLGNSVANGLLRGWQVTGITNVSSGFPFHPNTAIDYSRRLLILPRRPNRVCDGNLPTNQRTVERWFDTSCIEAPASTLLGGPIDTLGNAGAHYLDGDGTINQDFGLYKNFTVREPMSLQFRAEFFNLFNHPNFGFPASTLEAATFGRVTSATDGRIIQFGLKFRW